MWSRASAAVVSQPLTSRLGRQILALMLTGAAGACSVVEYPDASTDMLGLDASVVDADGALDDLTVDSGMSATIVTCAPLPEEPATIANRNDFIAAFLAVECKRALRCGASLSDYMMLTCHPRAPELADPTGLLDFPDPIDLAAAARCLASEASAQCRLNPLPGTECDDVYRRASLGAGAGCESDLECESLVCQSFGGCSACKAAHPVGGTCTGDDDCVALTVCQTGVCTPLGDVGAPCVFNSDCRPENWCGTGGRCAPLGGPVGSDCYPALPTCAFPFVCPASGSCAEGLAEGAPCGGGTTCGQGLVCAPASAPHCEPVVGPGCPCSGDEMCGQSFACHAGRCVPMHVVSEACSDGTPCADADCIMGICTRRPAGSVCNTLVDGSDKCAGFCDPVTNRCRALSDVGEVCYSKANCMPGLACPTAPSRVCVSPCAT